MTNEEAKRYLETTPLVDGGYTMTPIKTEVLAIAIQALNKQIPKRVDFTTDRTWGIEKEQPVCPECDCYLTWIRFIGNGKKISYCEHCGQAIDWSEDETE